MAIKNIKVQVQTPNRFGSQKMVFTDLAAGDIGQIPYRYPYADIANLTELQENGLFRVPDIKVANEYGGNNTTNANSALGYQLPRTEKLILLLKSKGAAEMTLTFSTSSRTSPEAKVVTIPAGAVGDIYTIDIYSLGLYIQGDVKNGGVTITPSAAAAFTLVARH